MLLRLRDGAGVVTRWLWLFAVLMPSWAAACSGTVSNWRVYMVPASFTGPIDANGQSKVALCNQYASAIAAAQTGSAVGTVNGGATECSVTVHRTNGTTATFVSDFYVVSGGPVACVDDPPDDCAALSGLPAVGGGSSTVPGTLCRTEDSDGNTVPNGGQCRVVRDGAGISTSGGWFGQLRFTGEKCAGAVNNTTGAGNCIYSKAGAVCVSREEKNCGKVNGESVCLASVPPGACTIVSTGGAVCSPTAPAPKNSGGTNLTPDGSITKTDSGGTTTTYNYYNSTNIANAVTGVPAAENPNAAGSGSGDGDGDGEGEGACTSDADCFGAEVDDSCLDNLTGCVVDGLSGAYESFGATPLLGAAAGLYTAVPASGACPVVEVSVFGEEHDAMAPFCSIMTGGTATLIELFFAVCWSFAGLRILLGGND